MNREIRALPGKRFFLPLISALICSSAQCLAAVADHAQPVIAIGLLVSPTDPEATSLRQGASLAIEQANRNGLAKARLIVRGQPGQWGADGDEAVALALDEGAAAMITPADGAAAHQILQVAGRTQVPVLSLCADSSITGAGVPWAVRIVPRTDEMARALFAGLANGLTGKALRATAFVPPGRAGREAARDLLAAAKTAGCELPEPTRLPDSKAEWQPILNATLANQPDAVLLWTASPTAGKLARALREAGFRGTLAGPCWLRSADFVHSAGNAAEGVIIPAILRDSTSETRWRQFARAYEKRFQAPPDFSATMAYDAALLAIELARGSPDRPVHPSFPLKTLFPGVSGPLHFDKEGNRMVTLALTACRRGAFQILLKAGSTASPSTTCFSAVRH